MRGDLMTGQGKTRETKKESITGHGNASKIDFLFDAYYAVARYTRAGTNCEMRFQTIKVESGLPNNYYQQQGQTLINRGFLK